MFKKSISIVLSLILLISVFSAASITANAYSVFYDSGDYTYQLLNDGSVEIVEYNASASSLTIPSQLDGYTVTGIGKFAFRGCSSLKKVIIPDCVKYIDGPEYIPYEAQESSAFFGCTNLETVIFGKGLESIGHRAFFACDNLKKVTIPPNVKTIEKEAFGYCFNWDEDNDYTFAIDGKSYPITIYGVPDSAAESYALKNHFSFVPCLDESTQAKLSMKAGEAQTISVLNSETDSVQYLSSNSKVAKINKNGKIYALKKGTVYLIAITGDNVYAGKLTVTTSPKLSKSSVTVKKGKTVSVKIKGKSSAVKNVYKNTKIAKVVSAKTAKKIKIKGLKKGKTTLKIKVNGVTLKLKVKVK